MWENMSIYHITDHEHYVAYLVNRQIIGSGWYFVREIKPLGIKKDRVINGSGFRIETSALVYWQGRIVVWSIGEYGQEISHNPGEWYRLIRFLALNGINLQSFFFLVCLNFTMLVVPSQRVLGRRGVDC